MTKKTKTTWIWETDSNPCSLCESMAGEYNNKPSVSPPLHPNCECRLIKQEIETEEELVEYDATGRMISPTETENQEYKDKYGSDVKVPLAKEMERDLKFKKALAKTAAIEGGYKPADGIDRGGETKFGITKKWYPNEDIKNLPRERADYLLYRDYYKRPNIDKLPDSIRDNVFDNAVNQGQPTAIRNLQEVVGARKDGVLGSITLRKIRGMDNETLRNNFKDKVNDVYGQIIENDPKQKHHARGWKNRVNEY